MFKHSCSYLNNKRNVNLSSQLLVFVAEGSQVPFVLLDSPNPHLSSGNNEEQPRRPVTHKESVRKPRQRFKEVVGARNPVETIAIRNDITLSVIHPQLSQDDVGDEVRDFSEKPNPNQNSDHGGRVVQDMVDVITNLRRVYLRTVDENR